MRGWRISVLCIVLCLMGATTTNSTVSPQDIFSKNRDTVVRIFVNGQFSGCGFIVSDDGLIVTANHVISTPESQFAQVFERIEIEKSNDTRSHAATVVERSVPSDTALLRIVASGLPHAQIETAASLALGDQSTIITFLPATKFELFVTGPVAGKGRFTAPPLDVESFVSQVPVRKGFSGSPVFDKKGRVVGITDTRLIGINPDLENAEIQAKQFRNAGGAFIAGIDFGKTMIDLIDTLDSDLVSGLGSSVDIPYAKQMIENHQGQK